MTITDENITPPSCGGGNKYVPAQNFAKVVRDGLVYVVSR